MDSVKPKLDQKLHAFDLDRNWGRNFKKDKLFIVFRNIVWSALDLDFVDLRLLFIPLDDRTIFCHCDLLYVKVNSTQVLVSLVHNPQQPCCGVAD